MVNKAVVKELYLHRYNYSEIGKLLGISRQRVHQIVKTYRTLPPKTRIEFKKYKCEICFNKAEYVHHIDGNSNNNDTKNLLSVCLDCHINLHRKKKRNLVKRFIWSKNFETCQNCFSTKFKYMGHGLCQVCYRIKDKTNNCQDCGKNICKNALRCKNCSKKGVLNPFSKVKRT